MRSSGPVAGISASVIGHQSASLRWRADCRDFCRSKDDPAAAKPATPLLSLRWTLRAKRACVVTDTEPDRLAPFPRQRRWASAGVGWWAARAIAPALRRAVAPKP